MGTDIPEGLVPGSYFNIYSAPSRVPPLQAYMATPINSYEECHAVIMEN
jgi:hypothetical protein